MSGNTLSGTSATRKPKTSDFCSKCGAWRGELGLEPHPALFVEHVVSIFAEVRRVMHKTGTLWLNCGDTYNGSWGNYVAEGSTSKRTKDKRKKEVYGTARPPQSNRSKRIPRGEGRWGASSVHVPNLKPKDLIGIPWRIAFALQDAGWWLRMDIVWSKPNPMPESVEDRPTRSHEYIFLLSKSAKYFYDKNAISEPVKDGANWKTPDGWDTGLGTHGSIHKAGREKGHTAYIHKETETPAHYKGSVPGRKDGPGQERRSGNARGRKGYDEKGLRPSSRFGRDENWRKNEQSENRLRDGLNERYDAVEAQGRYSTRNARSVWAISTQPFKAAHFATFPKEIPSRCIRAGSRAGDVVLDPFAGSGTTGEVALELGRKVILIELQPDYIPLIEKRLRSITPPLPMEVPA